MKKFPYQFSVLRYIHDPVTREFINIGVVLYSPKARFLGVRSTPYVRRANGFFGRVDAGHFRKQARFVKTRLSEISEKLELDLPLESSPKSLESILKLILPPDDSAFQFHGEGGGISSNLKETLEHLNHRYVEKYLQAPVRMMRSEDDIWKTFKSPLERNNVTSHLTVHQIKAQDCDFNFEHAWKNERWHALHPLSFDLAEGENIVTKAQTWFGRIESLRDSQESFKVYFLLGKPADSKLQGSFVKAQNILHKMQVAHDFVLEEGAEEFAEEFGNQILQHEAKG